MLNADSLVTLCAIFSHVYFISARVASVTLTLSQSCSNRGPGDKTRLRRRYLRYLLLVLLLHFAIVIFIERA